MQNSQSSRTGRCAIILVVFAAMLSAANTSRAQLVDGLVNYWGFENNLTDLAHTLPGSASSVADDGTFAGLNGTDGIAYGTGLFGSGISLDGAVAQNNGFVEITRSADTLFGANATNPGSPNTVTTSMWVQAAGFDTNWQTMISHGEGAQYRLARRGNTNVAGYAGGVGEGPQGVVDISVGWHHIVGISDGTVGQTLLYVDGVLDSTGGFPAINDAQGASLLNLWIGANPDTGAQNREWFGDIDDVAQWNRALSQAEVEEIYNAGFDNSQSLNDLISFAGDDSDGDGMSDPYEIANGLDPNDDGSGDVNNGPNGDPDMDGLINIDEFDAKTRADNPDTDDDGYNDGVETGDGTFDDIATDTGTDPLDPDTDDDGLEDGAETNTGNFLDAEDTGTNPLIPDTDEDGRPDGYETVNGQAPNDDTDGSLDPDMDDSDNEDEFANGTDPNNEDTDGDTLLDGVETNTGTYVDSGNTGTNPLSDDSDGDNLLDQVEDPALPFVDANQPGTDPTNPDSDGDFFSDGAEIAAGTDPTDPNSKPVTPVSLGTETISLLGGDLTDPEDDGDPEADLNYNAVFASSEEPGFGGGEFAFNVFDNELVANNGKWCCGSGGGFPYWVSATFEQPIVLTSFTASSANDTPARDPRIWEIQGSNDGATFDTIYRQEDPDTPLWTLRHEVLLFEAGTQYALPAAYSTIRFICFATGGTTGAHYQIGELEFFGTPDTSEFRITEITYDPDTDEISLTWPSREGQSYTLFYDTDLGQFDIDVDDGVPAEVGADFTTFTFDNPAPGAARVFFRVQEN